ncbi:calcium-dependent phosphotriesterase [Hypoxylon trugodes]|uniref:calcium-dependent phosphotriesterase n=1 Tax=Hypoxylon trugodes TaxID=326681 RepID=UPI0021A23F90|nr:calcium-dependent phosphotriesterase [Hypoxylon trugodes]KAI1387745.1 calcium-dependent phosphotriesterase [Hypoxylon trugodes]
MAVILYLTTIVVAWLLAILYAPVKQQITVLGLLRPLESWQNVHGIENHIIQDTIACEDLHYHEQSGLLYSACQGDLVKAAGWFPGAWSLDYPKNPASGSLVVIDPKTMKARKLSLENFYSDIFVTHGISLYTPPDDQKTIYILAINHLPNPLWTPTSSEHSKAASRVEVFVHKIGSNKAKHIRSISHPLIRTPNDLLALSENEFLVTNDHYYLDGYMRLVEELFHPAWTDLLHVHANDADNVTATVSLTSVPGNNGLGWGPNGQVLTSDATAGSIYFADFQDHNKTLSVSHSIQADGVVDNPFFFSDPYAGVDGKDYSGYLLPGIGRAGDFLTNYKDPTGKAPLTSLVYFLPASAGKKDSEDSGKKPILVFSDDGSSLRGATTAVIVAIDPATNDGKRQGWLFVTGVIAPHMLATKIDFPTTLA